MASETFDAMELRDELRKTAASLVQLFSEIDPAISKLRPTPNEWAPVEIAAHLVDEEREDFRERLRSVLEDPGAPLTSIDPEAWVVERKYIERDLTEVVEEFASERRASIGWLSTLTDADWNATHLHPKLGPLRAGDFLASWAAHDLLHISQLARTSARLLERRVAPYSTRYALP